MKKTIVDGAVEAFVERGFEAGDLITRDWIEEVLCLEEPPEILPRDERRDAYKRFDLQKLQRMSEFRTVLLHEYQIDLEAVVGKGYRVVPSREQATLASASAERNIKREIAKAHDKVQHTNVAQLTSQEQREHLSAAMHVTRLRELLATTRKLSGGAPWHPPVIGSDDDDDESED